MLISSLAETNLALVGLVTRLQHWLSILVEELTKKPARDKSLFKNLAALEEETGEGPIPISFFQGLCEVRDSIIHADSKTTWTFQAKEKKVADCYANAGEVAFTQVHLHEAIAKSIQQVKWYHERIS